MERKTKVKLEGLGFGGGLGPGSRRNHFTPAQFVH